MTTTLHMIGWLAAAAFGAFAALPAAAHHHQNPRGNATPSPHARSTFAMPVNPRLHGTAPAQSHPNHHPHQHQHRHYSPPRVIVVPRPVYVSPPVVRYVSPPVVYAPAPVYTPAPVYDPPTAYVPPAPPVDPPGGWHQARGPVMALDGASFIAGGVTYVLAGLRAWDIATPQGVAARDRLQQLLQSGAVMVWRVGSDSYGRAVARVVVNGAEIAEVLRREGFAAA